MLKLILQISKLYRFWSNQYAEIRIHTDNVSYTKIEYT